jgi:ABC-type multidrug transport system fused ATPase/permease subunit
MINTKSFSVSKVVDSDEGGDPIENAGVRSYDSGNESRFQNEYIRYLIQGIPFAFVTVSVLWLLDNVLLSIFFINLVNILSTMFVLAIMLIVLLGALNSYLAAALWDMKPNQTCTSFAGQGLLLVFMAYIFNPFLLIFLFSMSVTILDDIILYGITFLILAFIGGYLGKHIAAEFVGESERNMELASVHDRHVSCPHCGVSVVVGPTSVDEQRGTTCSACGRWFGVFDRGAVIE